MTLLKEKYTQEEQANDAVQAILSCAFKECYQTNYTGSDEELTLDALVQTQIEAHHLANTIEEEGDIKCATFIRQQMKETWGQITGSGDPALEIATIIKLPPSPSLNTNHHQLAVFAPTIQIPGCK